VELKRDAVGSVVLNQLYKFTPLQTSFGYNILALDHGRPRQMNIKDVLSSFIKFRKEVVTRRTAFELRKARERAHILVGLSLAVANIDEVIAIIRGSADVSIAKAALMEKDWNATSVEPLIKLVDDEFNVVINGRCKFTEEQAKAILEMRLARLTGLEQEKLTAELNELAKAIEEFLSILGDEAKVFKIIKDELIEIRENFATPRLTAIEAQNLDDDIEDLIAREDMVVTVTLGGYIKRTPLSTYRAQKRGGKGRSGIDLKEEDVTTQAFIANTHTPMMFFSTKGKVYKLKTYKLPLGNPQSRGRSLVNIFPLDQDEKINVILPVPEDTTSWEELDIIFATALGNIRRNKLSDFESIRANGKIAIRLEDNDSLIGVSTAKPSDHILLASSEGNAVRCPVEAVRVFKGRDSSGVRGIRLDATDKVISLTIINGIEVNTQIRDEYLDLPVETRLAIAKILPSMYSQDHQLKEESSLHFDRKITLEQLKTTGNEEVAEKLEKILTEANCKINFDTAIDYARNEEFILTITEKGFGKRTSAFEYRITNRGGKGVTNVKTGEKNGNVCGSFAVTDKDQILLVTDTGKLIRCPVDGIRITGRNASGVTIFRIEDNEKIVSAARIAGEEAENTEVETHAETQSEGAVSSETEGGE
ncbi:MAG: DNA gyrase C-terminal beta-propeller domain-containing protein, partial [Rickettsiales bacterium]|nr:DNA gyrase C-terminal beta-propeller domain-containing protein [Rickettsiales bacterium]